MTVFSVHIRDSLDRPEFVLVKDGFSWPAAIFGFVWALAIGAWRLALALFLVQMALGVALPVLIEDQQALAMVQLGAAVVIGLVANELRRVFLSMAGVRESGVVSAADRQQAEQRFLDAHPALTQNLLGE